MVMVTPPAAGVITDTTSPAPAGGGVAVGTSWFEQLRNFVAQLAGGKTYASTALASDTFTPTQSVHVLDTESGAASDNLASIGQGGGVPDGWEIRLRSTNAGRVITIKHNAGGIGTIFNADGVDFVLDDPTMWVDYERRGSAWYEIRRSYGNNKSAFRTWLGLVIGSTVQGYSALLALFAGLTAAANKLPYFTSTVTMATADFTSYARTLIALSSKAAVQAELGILPAHFHVDKNGTDQTGMSAGTFAKVTFPHAVTNVGGYWDTTNSWFTGATGDWEFTLVGNSTTNIVDQQIFLAQIYKNGSPILSGYVVRSSGTVSNAGLLIPGIRVNGLIATDKIEFYAFQGTAGSGSKTIAGGASDTYLQGKRVGD